MRAGKHGPARPLLYPHVTVCGGKGGWRDGVESKEEKREREREVENVVAETKWEKESNNIKRRKERWSQRGKRAQRADALKRHQRSLRGCSTLPKQMGYLCFSRCPQGRHTPARRAPASARKHLAPETAPQHNGPPAATSLLTQEDGGCGT